MYMVLWHFLEHVDVHIQD